MTSSWDLASLIGDPDQIRNIVRDALVGTGAGSVCFADASLVTVGVREVRDPQAQKGGNHPADDELGIHYTSQTLDPPPGVAGSVAYVIHQDGSAAVFRFGDGVSDMVDLAGARRVKP